MKLLKAFIAGIVVPSIILPIILTILLLLGRKDLLSIPFLHFIPIIWGFWNMFYFAFLKYALIDRTQNQRLFMSGAILGLLIALFGTFFFDIPERIGLIGWFKYLPILLAPILYGIFFRFLVKDLNHILYLKD